MHLKHLFVICCIVFVLVAGACSNQKTTTADVYNYVPANSPYVLGNVKPVPEAYLEKMIAKWQKLLSFQTKLMEERSQKATGNETEKFLFDLAKAALTEIETIKTPDDISSQFGISPKTTSVFYGLGLLPAIRIQIEDKQKVEELLSRLEEKSGQKISTLDFNGQPYRFIEVKDKIHLKIVLSVTDNHLIVGLIPGEKSGQDTFLPLLFSREKLKTPLTQSAFSDKLSQYNYPGYGDGYIDIQKIAAILRGEGEGINLASFKALSPEPDFKLQIGCNADFNRSLFQNIPRVAFGIKTLTENEFDMEMVLELSTHLIDIVKKIPQPIPDITAGADPMFAMGFGVDIPQLRMSIQQLLQFVIDNNQDCPDMNTNELKEVMPKLNMVMNPMISGFQALFLSLDHMEIDENGKPAMDTVSTCIVANMNDPQGLVAMGGAFLPTLANLNIKTDGTPEAVSLEGLPIQLPSLFVAIKDKRLVLAMGEEANQRATNAFTVDDISDMPIFWIKYKTSAWKLMKTDLSASQQMGTNDQKMVSEILKQYKDIYESITVAVYITDKGLSLRGLVHLK